MSWTYLCLLVLGLLITLKGQAYSQDSEDSGGFCSIDKDKASDCSSENDSEAKETFELTYFDGRGLAETSRLLFAIGGVQFKDIRMKDDDWVAIKPNTVFGKVPSLLVKFTEGEGGPAKEIVIPQSKAIERFISKKINLYGANIYKDAIIDAVVDQFVDIRTQINEAKSDEAKEKFLAAFPIHLNNLEKLSSKSSDSLNHFVGSLSWADVTLFNFVNSHQLLAASPSNIFNQQIIQIFTQKEVYPHLNAIYSSILNNERIKEYLSNRKVSEW